MSSPISIAAVERTLKKNGISIRHNTVFNEPEILGLPPDYSKGNAPNTLPVYITDRLKSANYSDVKSERVNGILATIADKNRFNPIKDMLNSDTWDGTHRISDLYEILGITDDKYKLYIRKWLIQCVALGLNNEDNPVSAEGVLVLQGPQGIAKTAFFRILMLPNPKFFVEGAVIDVFNKDSLINATSGWVCELGELDSTMKKEQSALKAFITQPYDKIRAPYARNATRRPRRTSFCGTVNPEEYLRDDTGSRRFWTVPVTQINKTWLFSLTEEWIKQLWFEVYELYQQDHKGFRLTDAQMAVLQADNTQYEIPLPYEIELRELVDFSLDNKYWRFWKSSQILQLIPGNANASQVGKVLKKIVQSEISSGRWATFTGPIPDMRIRNGCTEYSLPIKHMQVIR